MNKTNLYKHHSQAMFVFLYVCLLQKHSITQALICYMQYFYGFFYKRKEYPVDQNLTW